MAAKRKKKVSTAARTVLPSSEEPAGRLYPIVGIGASAGGLEAFRRLLKALPANTGMAFVLVQHLDPHHESILSKLLASSTEMEVAEVVDGMETQADHVYVIPPNTSIEVEGNVLHLRARLEAGAKHMTIDHFFRSLAETEASRAVGVILSGAASDGTLGLKAIKAEGGITFAQDEKTAKYDSMPRSAIAAGCVDFVLTPEGIARELARIGRHPYLGAVPAAHLDTPGEGNQELRRIFLLLRNVTGVDFTYYKYSTIKRRIARRMLLHKIASLGQYLKYLQENRAELSSLYEDILIHVTGFFREPDTFDELKETIFPRMLRAKPPGEPIRLWVAGCSTGEEAYSLAMVLLEYLGDKTPVPPIQIFATDIGDAALEHARAGVYSESSVADVSPDRLNRFFVRADGGYQITKSVREMCVFAHQDLTKDPPFSRLDLLSCRNVLIYMGPVLQKKVMTIFHYALKASGFLILGKSESMSGFAELFTPVGRKHKIYSRKPATSRPVFDLPPPDDEAGPDQAVKPPAAPLRFDLQREADRIVINNFAPPGLIANGQLQILHFRGNVAPFLSPASGEASLGLLRMVRPEFAVELRTAIHRARKQETPVRKEGLLLRRNGHMYTVALEVVPVNGEAGEQFYLVLFDQQRIAESDSAANAQTKASKALELELARVRRELETNKEYLQSIIEEQEATNEELKSANEEIQSSNEELQSTNEELETAKEELQSTNEELVTVNEQLQNRNLELGQLSDDLSNLLGGVNIPIVMLGNDRRIRRFTALAEKLLNLLPTDVGRPIDNIRPNFSVPDLESLIAEVVERVAPREIEITDRDGKWYALRLRPYRTVDNKIDGAVMIFVDIDELKRAQAALRQQTVFAEAVMQTAGALVLVTDGDGHIVAFNRACELVSGYRFEEVKGRSIFDDRLMPSDQVERARQADQKLRAGRGPMEHEMEWKTRIGGRRLIYWSNAAMPGSNGKSSFLVRIGTDITERRAAETALAANETALRKSQRELQALAAGLIDAQEEERKRISRDLHDGVSQKLAALEMEIGRLRQAKDADRPLRAKLAALHGRVSSVAADIRRTAYRLHPSSLDDLGLAPALKSYCREFGQQEGILVQFKKQKLPAKIPPHIALSLYRSAQETLRNVTLHSGARRATVTLSGRAQAIVLSVKDSGRGFDPARIKAGGLGLVSLEERARLIGGAFSLKAKPGEGVQIEIQVPLGSKRKTSRGRKAAK